MDHFGKLIYYNIITKAKLYTYYFLELKHKTKLTTLAPALFFDNCLDLAGLHTLYKYFTYLFKTYKYNEQYSKYFEG